MEDIKAFMEKVDDEVVIWKKADSWNHNTNLEDGSMYKGKKEEMAAFVRESNTTPF